MSRTLKSDEWFKTDGFPITIEYRRPQENFPPHKHEFSEIVIVTAGKGRHVVGHESWNLGAGDVFVIGGPRVHEFGELERLNLINILFQPEKLKVHPGDLASLPGYHALFGLETGWRRRHQFKNRLQLPPKALNHLLTLVEQLDEELNRRATGFGFVATAHFMQIMAFLSRCYETLPGPEADQRPRIAEVISYMESTPDKNISLNELVRVAGMSKSSLLRAFHEATGLTPIAYLNQLRITRAAAILRSSPDSITEIAFRAGFSDSNYFARQFRKLMGMTPRAYRRGHS